MRILFVVMLSTESADSRYRCLHIAEALRKRGATVDIVISRAASVTINHDIVVLHRLSWSFAAPFIAAARKIGAKIVYSADDLIFSRQFAYQIGFLYPDDPARYPYHRADCDAQLQTLKAADSALFSTDFLADAARKLLVDSEKPISIQVIRNLLNDEQISISHNVPRRVDAKNRRDDRIVLGYLSGSPTHNSDFADIALPLVHILQKHPQTRLLIVGTLELPSSLRKWVDDGRIRRHPFVPWRDLPGLLANLDINLAPLDPTMPFNHAKSEVKWLEAAACHVPTVANWLAGFAEAVDSPNNCALIEKACDWEATLDRLISDSDLRTHMADAAYTDVLAHSTTDAQADAIHTTFAGWMGKSSVTRSATVHRAPKVRFIETMKRSEMRLFQIRANLRRHFRLVRESAERGGS